MVLIKPQPIAWSLLAEASLAPHSLCCLLDMASNPAAMSVNAATRGSAVDFALLALLLLLIVLVTISGVIGIFICCKRAKTLNGMSHGGHAGGRQVFGELTYPGPIGPYGGGLHVLSGRDAQLRAAQLGSGTALAMRHSPDDTISGYIEIPRILGGLFQFRVEDLEAATEGFAASNLLGRPKKESTMYKGVLPNERVVAIKMFHNRHGTEQHMSIDKFRRELAVLSKLYHRNLVNLIGFCSDDIAQALVYDFLPHGMLRDHLKGKKYSPLSWHGRLQVLLGVAQALEYMHSFIDPAVVHKNVRSTNIFLERPRENGPWVGKLGNFGVSKKYLLTTDSEVEEEEGSPVQPQSGQIPATSRIQGLSAYLDPEFGISSRLTTMSDVFSIGVLLLEIITARQAFDPSREPSDLAGWARNYLDEGWETLRAIVDPVLLQTATPPERKQILEVSTLAKKCTKQISATRPKMWKVVEVLSGILDGSPESTEEHPRESAGDSQDQVHIPSTSSGLDYVRSPVAIPSHHSLTSMEIQEVESPLQRPRRGRFQQPVYASQQTLQTTPQVLYAARGEEEAVVDPMVDPEYDRGKTGVLFPDRYGTTGSTVRRGFLGLGSGSPLGPGFDGFGPGPSVRQVYDDDASLEMESFGGPRFGGVETSPSIRRGFPGIGSGPSVRPRPAAQTLPRQHSSPHVFNTDISETFPLQIPRSASVGRPIRKEVSPSFNRLNESPWNDDSNIDNSETTPSPVPRSSPIGRSIGKDTSVSSNRLNDSPWNDDSLP